MDPFNRKQAEIELKRTRAATAYPALWQRIMSEWTRPGEDDRAWLLYSANYLLCTGGVRWALDPLTLQRRVPSTPDVDVSPLADLDYVVLSHRHADHFDINLLKRLAGFPATWIIPEFMLESFRTLDIRHEKIIVARAHDKLHLGELTLTPFTGLHWEHAPGYPDDQRGVPALGFLAEFNGKRWLFPGDTRTYDASQLPAFGRVDGLIAHIWLGRGLALQANPGLLEAFCQFVLDLSPGPILLTHLEEFGREANEFWDPSHAEQIMVRLGQLAPGIDMAYASMGDMLEL